MSARILTKLKQEQCRGVSFNIQNVKVDPWEKEISFEIRYTCTFRISGFNPQSRLTNLLRSVSSF